MNPYSPTPLTLLKFLATTVLTLHSFPHILAAKSARARSLAEPVFGLREGVEGVLQGLGANHGKAGGMVLEMEHRRKSGRGVREWFYLPSPSSSPHVPPAASTSSSPGTGMRANKEIITLLEDHPQYCSVTPANGGAEERPAAASTFELGLTEKQRRDRDGVVLPYYDAQTAGGGEGGRILYDMGSEDDFDEEEDEI